jgi:hypothetical protein
MNATLAVELPFTNFNTQTTIPFGYIDPPTEIIKDGETQIWKLTHNGVDTHAVHFHLFTVQVLNRMGWDGAIRPPDPNEMGWKDTLRMNPLEDIVFAVRPLKPALPWPIPDSIRPLDVTSPLQTTGQFSTVDANGNVVAVSNTLQNFGWEYVWHCHLLGHEENDMMRPIVFQAPPLAPSTLTAMWTPPGQPPAVQLSWIDNSLTAEGFTLQRANDAAFTQGVSPFTVPFPGGAGTRGATITFSDTTAGNIIKNFFYRVRAYGVNGTSAWSNVARTLAAPAASVQPASLAFGGIAVNATSPAQTVTLSNTGVSPLTVISIVLAGANPGDFLQTSNCGATVAGGSSCRSSVTFKPTAAGARAANLVITTDDPSRPTVIVPLSGTGLVPVAGVSPSALTFPDQPVGAASATQAVMLSNSGQAPLAISRVAGTGTNAGDFLLTNACPANLAAGAQCAIGATFKPTAQGARSAAITITSNDPAKPSLAVTLGGNGIAAGTPPQAPTNLTASLSGANTVVLKWQDHSNNETGFYVERSLNKTTWTRIATVTANSTQYSDRGLNRRTTYWYRVQAYNSGGVSAYTNSVSATTK